MRAADVPLSAPALLRWLRERGADVERIQVGARTLLSGGVASDLVQHVRVTAAGAGRTRSADVVVKRASAAEALAMALLREVPDGSVFPELIDAGTDESGSWLVMPFYPGAPLSAEDELPAIVYACLARMHATFQDQADRLPAEIPRIDRRWCRAAFTDYATESLHQAQKTRPHPLHARALTSLRSWADSPLTYVGLELLPPTLLHADAYGLNVLVSDESPPQVRLVDWGGARIGPAMLDVAMAAGPDSAGLAAYLRSWTEFTGCARDPWLTEVGHTWATLINHAIFIGAVAQRFGVELAEAMLETARTAHARLKDLMQDR